MSRRQRPPRTGRTRLTLGSVAATLLLLAVFWLYNAVISSPQAPPAPPQATPTAVLATATASAESAPAKATSTRAPTEAAATASPAPAEAATQAIPTPLPGEGLPTLRAGQLPPQARAVIDLIAQGGPFPYRQDGTVFQNREKILPAQPKGYYHEYTVETPGSPDRGPRRLVAGAQGELYYTDDHYASFRRVIP